MDNVSLFFSVFNLNDHFWLLDKLMVFGATSLIYLTFVLVLFLGLKGNTKDKKAFLFILLGVPISILLIKIIHLFFFETRPFVAFHLLPKVVEKADASFPSRHATISAVIAFSFVLFHSRWSFLFLLTMLWIGLSRVYVGVHYPLDILGGFVTAVVALIISLRIKNLLKTYFFR